MIKLDVKIEMGEKLRKLAAKKSNTGWADRCKSC